MRYFVFSDIHGNLEALLSIIKFTKRRKIDHYIFLGDMVGYGASPNEVIEKMRSTFKPISIVRGNHDKAVCGLDSIQTFNPIAASAIFWTQQNIKKTHKNYLCRLKAGQRTLHKNMTICHGAPFDEDFYIFSEFDAAEAFSYMKKPLCFFGHTHFPFIYIEGESSIEGIFITSNKYELKLEKKSRYLINPGSVGQPRDRNPRAACLIYDSKVKKVNFYRLDYDIEKAKEKINQNKLPSALAERLSVGI